MPNHTPDIPTKQCTKCGETFPATAEYWHKKKRGKYGLFARCKGCLSEYHRQWYESNRGKRREQNRQWTMDNSDKWREYRRQWTKDNPEKAIEYQRRYYETNRDEICRRRRQYRESNLEKERKRGRRWAKNNPDKARAIVRNRIARKRNAEGSHTAAEVREQFKRQKGKCYWCNSNLDKNNYHADHVIPLSKGGSNYISNIVCACPTCNLSKHDKLPHEWDGNGGRLL